MYRNLVAPALCLAMLAASWMKARADHHEPIALGSRREPFVDHFLIDRLDGARLVLHRPRDEGVAVKFDRLLE